MKILTWIMLIMTLINIGGAQMMVGEVRTQGEQVLNMFFYIFEAVYFIVLLGHL